MNWKTLAGLFSLALMAELFYDPFTTNMVMHNVYSVNEFIHWVLVVLLILAYFATAAKRSMKLTKKQEAAFIKSNQDIIDNRRGLFGTIIRFINYPALAFLCFYIGDWSFAIALFLGMVISHLYTAQAKDIVSKKKAK